MLAGAYQRAMIGVAAVACAGLIGAGCASPRNALGPSESPCFQAIPAATRVAPRSARFAGVRYLSVARLERAILGSRPSLASTLAFDTARTATSCVVAFHGRFSSTLDDHSSGPSHGHYLIVVIGLRGAREIGALVLAREPFRLVRLLPTSH